MIETIETIATGIGIWFLASAAFVALCAGIGLGLKR